MFMANQYYVTSRLKSYIDVDKNWGPRNIALIATESVLFKQGG